MEIAFAKAGGLVPAIIQDNHTGDVLMLGFLNEEALAETRRTREVVARSRCHSIVVQPSCQEDGDPRRERCGTASRDENRCVIEILRAFLWRRQEAEYVGIRKAGAGALLRRPLSGGCCGIGRCLCRDRISPLGLRTCLAELRAQRECGLDFFSGA